MPAKNHPLGWRAVSTLKLNYDCSAEHETKVKAEKVAQIKRINAHIMTVRGDVSKFEDTLKEYQLYKNFLFSIAPMVGSI